LFDWAWMSNDLWVDEVSEDRGWRARVLPYGIEAPYVPAGLGAAGAACCAVPRWRRAPWAAAVGVALLAQAGLYLHTTVRGKVRVWRSELERLGLRGNEQLLDLGCGRGAVLIEAARHLPAGRAVGVDVWRSQDQSGNDPDVTLANARAAGVADRVDLHTADMTALPFPDGRFDVVTSALAIHNIPTSEGRHQALDEALRVLRPGGRLLIADFRYTADYRQRLGSDAQSRELGPGYWYGGPWAATTLLCTTKR